MIFLQGAKFPLSQNSVSNGIYSERNEVALTMFAVFLHTAQRAINVHPLTIDIVVTLDLSPKLKLLADACPWIELNIRLLLKI